MVKNMNAITSIHNESAVVESMQSATATPAESVVDKHIHQPVTTSSVSTSHLPTPALIPHVVPASKAPISSWASLFKTNNGAVAGSSSSNHHDALPPKPRTKPLLLSGLYSEESIEIILGLALTF